MPCYLSLIGHDFDINNFIGKTRLKAESKTYKGQPRVESNPGGYIMPYSVLGFTTSAAGFEEFEKQVSDTISFLEINKYALENIKSFEGIEYATLDFGINSLIDNNEKLVHTTLFPTKLLLLCGELGISIELSIYSLEIDKRYH